MTDLLAPSAMLVPRQIRPAWSLRRTPPAGGGPRTLWQRMDASRRRRRPGAPELPPPRRSRRCCAPPRPATGRRSTALFSILYGRAARDRPPPAAAGARRADALDDGARQRGVPEALAGRLLVGPRPVPLLLARRARDAHDPDRPRAFAHAADAAAAGARPLDLDAADDPRRGARGGARRARRGARAARRSGRGARAARRVAVLRRTVAGGDRGDLRTLRADAEAPLADGARVPLPGAVGGRAARRDRPGPPLARGPRALRGARRALRPTARAERLSAVEPASRDEVSSAARGRLRRGRLPRDAGGGARARALRRRTALVERRRRPDRLGAYRVARPPRARRDGRGLLGERADGLFEQRVAIKLLRRGMDSEDVLAGSSASGGSSRGSSIRTSRASSTAAPRRTAARTS